MNKELDKTQFKLYREARLEAKARYGKEPLS